VWVPATHVGETVQLAIERQTKRVTILAGITLSGAIIRPLVIIPRKSFELELSGLGYTDYAIFTESQKGYINKDRFKIWLLRAVGPYLEEVRRDLGKPESRALLIIDGCSAHEDIDETCRDLLIDVLRLPAHSSHLLQPLDLVTFGLQKKRYARIRLDSKSKLNKLTQNIHRILFSFQQASASSNNVAAFRKAGIILSPSCSDGHITLRAEIDRRYALKAMSYLASPECKEADLREARSSESQVETLLPSSSGTDPLDEIIGAPSQVSVGVDDLLLDGQDEIHDYFHVTHVPPSTVLQVSEDQPCARSRKRKRSEARGEKPGKKSPTSKKKTSSKRVKTSSTHRKSS